MLDSSTLEILQASENVLDVLGVPVAYPHYTK